MSEKQNQQSDEIVEAAKDAARDSVESPIANAVQKIAQHSVKMENRLNDRVAQHERATKATVDELSATVRDGFDHVGDRLDAMQKSNATFGRIEDVTAPIKACLTDDQKARMGEALPIARGYEMRHADSALAKPEAVMLGAEWFEVATKLQSRKYLAHRESLADRLSKIDRAFADAAGVTKAALQEDTGAEGGYLVPTIVETEILRQVLDAGEIFPRGRQMSLRTKTTQVPSESTAVTVNWIDEEGTLTGGEPTFAQTALVAEKLAGRATMSIEVVQDSGPGLLAYLLSVFTEKMARELDKQMVLGDGSGPQFTGIINASGINAVTSGTAGGRSLTWGLLVDTFTAAGEQSARRDGVWICSPKGYAELLGLTTATDGTGPTVIQFGENVTNAPSGTLLGRPIIVTNGVGGSATLDDTTNTATKIVFGPLRSLLCGTRAGMTWDVTDQVNWAKYQMDARLIGRFAGNVGVPADFSYLGQIAY